MNNTASAQPKKFFRGKVFPVLLGLLVIILALLAGAHLVLERHCAVMARQRILPWLQARYQANVQLQNISINILTGVLVVEGATIGNPPGFAGAAIAEMPHFRLRLALHDLWRKDTVTIRSLRIRDARLNLIRNPQGQLNLAGARELPAAARRVHPDRTHGRPRRNRPGRRCWKNRRAWRLTKRASIRAYCMCSQPDFPAGAPGTGTGPADCPGPPGQLRPERQVNRKVTGGWHHLRRRPHAPGIARPDGALTDRIN